MHWYINLYFVYVSKADSLRVFFVRTTAVYATVRKMCGCVLFVYEFFFHVCLNLVVADVAIYPNIELCSYKRLLQNKYKSFYINIKRINRYKTISEVVLSLLCYSSDVMSSSRYTVLILKLGKLFVSGTRIKIYVFTSPLLLY